MRLGLVMLVLATSGCDVVFKIDRIPDALTGCPASYRSAPTGNYLLVESPLTWPEAAATCAADQIAGSIDHTHLVVISTPQEHELLKPQLTTATWIGLSSVAAYPTFQWVTAEPDTAEPAWHELQPNDGRGACVTANNESLMIYDDLFYDRTCTLVLAYLCECDRFADDPVRYTPPPPP